jgi:hypothetical protein
MSDNITIKDGTLSSVVTRSTDMGGGIQIPHTISGGTDDRVTVIPTIQAASYVSGNNIGGLMSFTLFRAASGILNSIMVKFIGGATTPITVYCFDSNPTASTFTDKGTFTLALADVDRLICSPQVLTPAVQGVGSTVTFQEAVSMSRMFKSTSTIYCACVAGGTFTPASVADMHLSIHYDLNVV